ncbi:GNAT family N-acetyltransferase [Alphaproteobacteria bacterium 46_93_T64]|nr:GNAT family N-acetyltransferase [Alphaproteobacteria bacterium 46_93_T64]
MTISTVKIDYTNTEQANDLVFLLSSYALDPMGGEAALPNHVKDNLARRLSELPHAFSIISYVAGKPAALANCFDAFSTFACAPLINVHDIIVLKEFRGLGLSQKLLDKIEEIAREKECCKITLEVLSGNKVAQNSYRKFGFAPYSLDPEAGEALFWQKKL